jgi:hypothetical protein
MPVGTVGVCVTPQQLGNTSQGIPYLSLMVDPPVNDPLTTDALDYLTTG